ncbi:hypothetical protein KIW84_021169 [Lathyrus oleraceus]|uniref:Uncharacterized protein n=1 Tax=Pisum sativum TaxID=3888 RepID=A0A9D4Y8B6_PEA|nr:hypothetical protein KIW84_021169 [Pisum sativum]
MQSLLEDSNEVVLYASRKEERHIDMQEEAIKEIGLDMRVVAETPNHLQGAASITNSSHDQSDPEKIHKKKQKLVFNKFAFSENKGYYGGINMVWKVDVIDVDVEIKHFQFIHMKIKVQNGSSWYFTLIYVSPRKKGIQDLWDNLLRISYNLQDGWIIGGDFNNILLPYEKKGNIHVMIHICSLFRDHINSCSLLDMDSVGHKTLPRVDLYDHHPILISLKDLQHPSSPRTFKFESSWIIEDFFEVMLNSTWNYSNSFLENLELVKSDVSS